MGAFSYSHGLEQAIAEAGVEDGDSLTAWIATLLEQGGPWTDAVLLTEAFAAASLGDGGRLAEAVEFARALAPSKERARESEDQGFAFLEAVRAWNAAAGAPAPGLKTAPYPIAVGSCCAAAEMELSCVLLAYLNAFAANLISAAIRLAPLGQRTGVGVLAKLQDVVLRTARRAERESLDGLGSFALASDIASMRHESLTPRLFIS